MTDAKAEFERLVALRDERLGGIQDPRLDAVRSRMRTELIATVRNGLDELGRIDCAGNRELEVKLAQESEWLRAVLASMAAPQ